MTGRRTPTAWRSCSSGSASGWPTADRLPIWCSFVPGGWTTRSCLWCPTNRRPASAAGDRCAASGDRVGRRPGAAPAGRHPGSGAGGVRRGPAGGGAGPARRRSGCGGGRVPGGPPGGVDRGVGVGGRRGDGGARHVVGRGVEPAGPVRDAGGGVPGHPGRAGGRGDRPGACPDAHRRAGSTRALPARGGGDAAAGRCSRPHGRATASFGETGGAARRRECGARRLAAAIRDRSVRAHPGEDGMGTLAATMPIPLLEACRAALRGYAEECATPDDVRTLDQRMLDCLADLILRPGAGDVSPVQVQLTLVAGVDTMRGGDEPGELNGQPVPAVLVRELAQTLGLLPNVTDRSRLDPTEISVPVPTDAIPTGPDPAADGAHFPPSSADAAAPPPLPVSASDLARARLAELLALRSTVGPALAGPPQIAVVDEISGQLLALTSAAGIGCALAAGTGLGPPPETPGYRPSAPLERFVRARDRRCRFPGCRAAAIRCDLDHNQIWPAGATSEGNLCCLCRHHHRLSHQAPGWTMHRLPDGGLRWTSPSGHVLTTHPPAYGSDDQPQPENPDPVRPPGTLELLRRAPQPPDPTDPAPF